LPIYEYKCANGHVFETVQSMSDDPVTECEVCGAPVERVFHPVAVHFKGSGFYTTDYGSKKKGAGDGAKEKDSSKSDSASKPKDSKPKATSDSSSGSGGGD
jgi:putative FmdB family regulatory protein